MTERPATRADLRVAAWQVLYARADPVNALRLLQALDADEMGDEAGGRYVARILAVAVTVIGDDGCLLLRRRVPEPVR